MCIARLAVSVPGTWPLRLNVGPSDAEVLVDLLQRGGWSVRRSGDTTRLDSNRFRECAVLEVSAKPKER